MEISVHSSRPPEERGPLQPFYSWDDGFVLFCTRQQDQDLIWILILPFPPYVWLLLFGAILCVSIVLMVISVANSSFAFMDSSFVSDNIFLVWRVLVGEKLPRKKKRSQAKLDKSRSVLLLFWTFNTMLLIWLYQSNLKAVLSSPAFEKPIQSLEEFLNSENVLVMNRFDLHWM